MPSASYRLRRGRSALDLNRGAIFGDTAGVLPSKPLHQGVTNREEEWNRLRSSYSQYHGPKVVLHDRRAEIQSKATSRRLLAGTNEFAEDLTGQRLPLNASEWTSETKSKFDGKVHRPSSAPSVQRTLSQMDNQEPLFAMTARRRQSPLSMQDTNPSQSVAPSCFRERDMYQSTYSFDHRPFGREEQLNSSYWNKERRTRPWLQEPVTNFSLKIREPETSGDNRLYPNEAQLATLPHYVDPLLRLGRSEIQESFKDPYKAPQFYFEEPNQVKKPEPVHLQRTFVN